MNSNVRLSNSEMKNILGENIRKYRDEKCITQDYMANKLGISQSTYFKMESGAVKISINRLKTIALIFGKSMEIFLGDSASLTKQVEEEKNIIIKLEDWELLKEIVLKQQMRIEELESLQKK